MSEELVTLKRAAEWASEYLDKTVTSSNISYLIQYAKINKYKDDKSKSALVSLEELKSYYDRHGDRKVKWKQVLGDDLNWSLSFDHLTEAETTKHVHRLHPYKGKFIPQLVEYFLDEHVNSFKTRTYFHAGDIILDPFMGSGTTLVQASELGLHSIGIDISEFNCLIVKVKTDDYNLFELKFSLVKALQRMKAFCKNTFDDSYDEELKRRLAEFNKNHFPNPEFKHMVKDGKIDEEEYISNKLELFHKENDEFLNKNSTKDKSALLSEDNMSNFVAKWFSDRIRQEISHYKTLIEEEQNNDQVSNVMQLVLSRTARSCRSTTHSDLATLKEPQIGPYYCEKHYKICTPINSILKHLEKNTYDIVDRLQAYSMMKKDVFTSVIHGDSRNVDIFSEVQKQNPLFYEKLKNHKIDGVFSSPPYVGQIDYHEQHAYAYEMFGIPRRDEDEIGPMSAGTTKKAKENYIEGISNVLTNVSKYMKDDGEFFIVANDKFNVYPIIAEKCNLKIVQQFKRPVLNRTERDRQPYAEIIFNMRKM